MSLNGNRSNISRQQLLLEYLKSPESAPLKRPGLVSTMAAEDYRFETLMARFSSPASGGLVDEATHDAARVKKGYGFPIAMGVVAICAGWASFSAVAANPLLSFVGLACLYFGVTWIRQGVDKIRQSNYNCRFATDVVRYAEQAADTAERDH